MRGGEAAQVCEAGVRTYRQTEGIEMGEGIPCGNMKNLQIPSPDPFEDPYKPGTSLKQWTGNVACIQPRCRARGSGRPLPQMRNARSWPAPPAHHDPANNLLVIEWGYANIPP